ncbi:MAG: T9SS type A sorting domain-containing protein, partial [Flavobacteriales bacterium]|nr:T9SS type A sorting domain-containing protein [Flavobacteriales bacterium]
ITVGLNELQDEDKVSIFPNPIKDVLHLRLEKELIQSIELFNTKGQLVLKQRGINNKNLSLNLEAYVSGIYFIRIISNHSMTTKKVIIE